MIGNVRLVFSAESCKKNHVAIEKYIIFATFIHYPSRFIKEYLYLKNIFLVHINTHFKSIIYIRKLMKKCKKKKKLIALGSKMRN